MTVEEFAKLAKANPFLHEEVRDECGNVRIVPLRLTTERLVQRTAIGAPTSEHDEQVALFAWAAANLERYPALRWMHANPNGGHRHVAVASKLKAEGVRKGVLDIYLIYPARGFPAMACELKVGKNRPTKEQAEWIAHLKAIGWYVVLCYSATDARKCIEWYLEEA